MLQKLPGTFNERDTATLVEMAKKRDVLCLIREYKIILLFPNHDDMIALNKCM